MKAAEACGFGFATASSNLSTLELCAQYVKSWQTASARPVLRVRARDAQKTPHSACVIFAHGLGNTGEGWAYSFMEMAERLPHVLFLFPTARTTAVTCNGGMEMPSWYDIAGLDVNRLKMDAPGIEESAVFLQSMVELESYNIGTSAKQAEGSTASTDNNSAPAHHTSAAGRVILAGFSQGGALTMYAGHTCDQRLGGMLVLSGYCTQLNQLLLLDTKANTNTPLLMCHGTSDGVVPFPLARESFGWATSAGTGLRGAQSESVFTPLEGVGHESSEPEMAAVEAFIARQLPPI